MRFKSKLEPLWTVGREWARQGLEHNQPMRREREKHLMNCLSLSTKARGPWGMSSLSPRDKGGRPASRPHLEAAAWKNVQRQLLICICWSDLFSPPSRISHGKTTNWSPTEATLISVNNISVCSRAGGVAKVCFSVLPSCASQTARYSLICRSP